jgi:hypothetical protein
LTFDNDKAFSCHTKVANRMDVKTFFTRPYTSQDTILTKVYKEVLIDSQKSSDECDFTIF